MLAPVLPHEHEYLLARPDAGFYAQMVFGRTDVRA